MGELIQIDGSPHDWFEGRGRRCTLIVFIDDATGRLTALYFAREGAAIGRLRGQAMAPQGKSILLLAADAIALRQVFRGQPRRQRVGQFRLQSMMKPKLA